MSDRLIDVRTTLAASSNVRIERGNDGTLHVLVAATTLHMDRAHCEELTTTLARAMVLLAQTEPTRQRRSLRLVDDVPQAADPNAD